MQVSMSHSWDNSVYKLLLFFTRTSNYFALWLVLTYYLLKDRRIGNKFWFLYYIKQIDSILLCICPVIHVDHRRHQNVEHQNISDALAQQLICYFFALNPILTLLVIYYGTDAQQHGICLLNVWMARVLQRW